MRRYSKLQTPRRSQLLTQRAARRFMPSAIRKRLEEKEAERSRMLAAVPACGCEGAVPGKGR